MSEIAPPRQDEIDTFWVDAKLRANLNRLAAYWGPTELDSLQPPASAFGGTAEVADELARGSTWCTAEHLTIGDVCIETYVMTIRYDDRYARTPDGWRIVSRTLVLLDEAWRQGD